MPQDPQTILFLPPGKNPRKRSRIGVIARAVLLILLVVALMLGVIALWDYVAGSSF